jgi:hypothetical protein
VWKAKAPVVTYDGSAAKNEEPLGNSENGQARRKRTIRARLFGHKIRCQSGQNCKRPTTPKKSVTVKFGNNRNDIAGTVASMTEGELGVLI